MVAAADRHRAAEPLILGEREHFIECPARLEGAGLLEEFQFQIHLGSQMTAKAVGVNERRTVEQSAETMLSLADHFQRKHGFAPKEKKPGGKNGNVPVSLGVVLWYRVAAWIDRQNLAEARKQAKFADFPLDPGLVSPENRHFSNSQRSLAREKRMEAKWYRRRRRFCCLNVEPLEDRRLLSTFTVDRLTDTGDGSGLAGDLRYCITQATSGQDIIQFGVTGTISLSKALPDLMSSVMIEGPGADMVTVQRSTGGNYRVFTVDKNAVVEISSLTIANGLSSTQGGGLSNDGTLTLDNIAFSGNSAVQGGGGIYNSPSGSLTVSDTTLSNNKTAEGSGGAMLNDGMLTISKSTISANHAAEGAGLYNSSPGTLTIANCTISSNTGANDGGGIYNSGTLAITGSTISGNTAIDNGGGILSAGTLTVSGTTVSSNSISDSLGSAVDAFGGPVTMSDSTFTGNMAHSGFGTLSLKSPTAMLTNCLISNNNSGMAGGIVNNGTLMVSNSTVSGNTSGGSGTAAGIVNGGTLTVSDSTVSGNSGFAGGIWNSASLTVSNSTVSGNSALIQGVQTSGGIVDVAQNGDATVQLLNATVANNTVSGNSRSSSQLLAGRSGTSTSQATIELHNTLIAGDGSKPNFFADTGGRFVSDGHNLSNDDGGGYLTGPGDLVSTNPLLSPLQDNGGPTQTMALLPGSPAINAGDNANVLATDQRGLARSSNGRMDMGAFESRGFTLTITSGDNQQTLVDTLFAAPLAVSVSSSFGEPVQGGLMNFTAPAGGSSATFPLSNTAVVDSNGQASVAAFANASSGSYVVMASATGATAVGFHLINVGPLTLGPSNLPDGTAGMAYSQTLTADGGAGGPITFAVTSGSLPAGYTLSSDGVLSGSTTKAATSSFTVTATAAGGISGNLAYTLTIDPAAAAIFLLTGFPSSITAGVPGDFMITAEDAFGNVATGYAGTVHFSSSDPQAVLPSDMSLTGGTGTSSATLTTAGLQSMTASDVADSALIGSQSGIAVNPGNAARLLVLGPSSVSAGSPFSLTIQAVDPFGNMATGYLGTVSFHSSDTDARASLLSNYTFTAADSGVHFFTNGMILRTVGNQTVTATDTLDASINGNASIRVTDPVFLVTTTLDSGDGSLRQAILDADATPGPDIILFAIGTGFQTINLASPLPAITQPIMIDGTSQPGYSGSPLIQLNGADAGPNADGLLITAGNSMVLGLVINRFSLNGIELQNSGGNALEGNYIGTDVTGTRPLGNGVGVLVNSSNNMIGGTADAAGNIIAGNQGNGIVISEGSGNVVQGNFIGTDPSRTINLGNGNNGVYLANASGNTIGGTDDAAGNVIAYNGNDGVLVDTGSENAIERNAIFYHEAGLGIELRNGGNDRLPFPILISATSDGSSTSITGLLLSTPDTAFTLELFANSISNPSGFGEGEQFLGATTVTTDQHGLAMFTVAFPVAVPSGEFIAATATDPDNNTSAFSNCVGLSGPAAPPGGAALGITRTGSDEGGVQATTASVVFPVRADIPTTPMAPAESRPPLKKHAIERFFSMRQPERPSQLQADSVDLRGV
jgi:hypothetical protein